MPPTLCRMRPAVTCALVVALTASFTLEPALAQPAAGSWQVAESVNIDTVGFAPALSPDGRWVAGLKDLDERQLCIWKVSTGEERCNGESHRVADASIAWSPDGTAMVYGFSEDETTNRDSTILVQDMESGELLVVMAGVSLQLWEGVTGIEWTANDQLVLPLDDGSFEVVTLERT